MIDSKLIVVYLDQKTWKKIFQEKIYFSTNKLIVND